MPARFSVIIALCLALCGCVLKSSQPVFTDQETELIFGSGSFLMEVYALKDGKWQPTNPDEVAPRLVSLERHYFYEEKSANDNVKRTDVSFAPVGQGIFVVQMHGHDGEVEFGMASWDGKQLLARSLDCDLIRGVPGAGEIIDNDGSECRLKGRRPTPAEFMALNAALGQPNLKVVITKMP